MSDLRYPENLVVSLEDFLDSGWKQALAQARCEGYPKMYLAFSAAASKAVDQGDMKRGKVLWLLAGVCSMILSPSSTNEPFKPFAVVDNWRTRVPDDFTTADIAFFASIVDSVDNDWLKARLCDLVWLKGKPRNMQFALKAIDAYRSLPLKADTWIHGGRDCWPRALCLARSLKAGAGNRLSQMEAAIVQAFNAATTADGFLGLWLADLLKAHDLGRNHRMDVALKLESLAREFDAKGNLHEAREYFSATADWYKAIPNAAKAAETTAAAAEACAKEATARISSENPSHMAAESFYEQAIQTYRKIPKAERASLRVDERIEELRILLNNSGQRSLEEMSAIQSPTIDLTELVDHAKKAVSGKSAEQALLAFANLYRGADVEQLRADVQERMRRYPLLSLFPHSVISSDGRVIAKRPAMGSSSNLTENDEKAIRAEMDRDYGLLINIVILGSILPALEALRLEHRLRLDDFTSLARKSPVIPQDRATLFGKALFHGYDGDFVVALHLLVPQIEHLVRVHLKRDGVKTTTLDKDGIETENGLSTLMDLPESERVFGKDLAFEIKSLFCDAYGPNLRNELAHGLIGEQVCNSHYSIYAWWLALRLTFNSWWCVTHGGEAQK